jgi:hypothetical protein
MCNLWPGPSLLFKQKKMRLHLLTPRTASKVMTFLRQSQFTLILRGHLSLFSSIRILYWPFQIRKFSFCLLPAIDKKLLSRWIKKLNLETATKSLNSLKLKILPKTSNQQPWLEIIYLCKHNGASMSKTYLNLTKSLRKPLTLIAQ